MNTSPGPSTYTLPSLVGTPIPLSTFTTPPAYSLRAKTPNIYDKSLQTSQFPSSHDYSPSDRLTRRATTPSYSIRQRFDSPTTGQNDTVGPAAYSPTTPDTRIRISMRPKTVDPAEIARNKNRFGTPSALDYTIPSSVGESNFWPNLGAAQSMLGKHPDINHERHTPGPADYTIRSTIGSGQVVSTVQNPSGVSFKGTGKGSQSPLGSSGPNIGPNSYSLPSVFSGGNDKSIFKSSGTGYSFNSRHEYPYLDHCSPGPAAYDISTAFTSESPKQSRFSQSQRLLPTAQEKHRATTPAPSAYGRVDARFAQRRAPAWSIRSKSERPSKAHLTPGPDNYGYASLPKTHIPISVKGRWKEPPSNPSVGPGAYGVLHLPHLELLYKRTANFKRPSTHAGTRPSRDSKNDGGNLHRSRTIAPTERSIFDRTGLVPGRISSHGIERK